MGHQKHHMRTSKYGRRFPAGRGYINYEGWLLKFKKGGKILGYTDNEQEAQQEIETAKKNNVELIMEKM